MKVTFVGATGGVTGSKYLVESARARVLVDCGLFQGPKAARERNWMGLGFEPASLDAVLLTHAHIDHSGYLPALVRDGFDGPIHATPATRELCNILLPDSGRIQEEDAGYANRKGFSRHKPALPLYTEEDARRALPRIRDLAFDQPLELGDLGVRLRPAGHILGAASCEITGPKGRIVFSGDVGRQKDLLMRPPVPPDGPDWIVTESTYGDRLHGTDDPLEAVAGILRRTLKRGGVLLIPSFAVGRCQALLYCLHEIFRRELAPEVPVYVNSPMATSVTGLYERFCDDHRLSTGRCAAVFDMPTYVRSVEESKALNGRFFPSVIISASGMATGGRVLHHLKALLPEHRHTVLLPGFQAPGTRGADLARGAEQIRIHGGDIPVRAEIVQLSMFSAHADRDELLAWLSGTKTRPIEVFVTHGEPSSAAAFRDTLETELGWDARVPEPGETVELG